MSTLQERVRSSEQSAPLVRAQLVRILSSELFVRSDRLSAFLKFIVDETLNGRGDTLKEQVIATELYRKSPDFSPAADPIVRVDARRLRDRLREYYASAPHDVLVISVPKGSYTPVFEVHAFTGTRAADAGRMAGERMPRPLRRLWIGIAAAAVAVGAAAWSLILTRTPTPPPPRLLTVTSLPGSEGGPPALSPDGNFVVFNWSGPDLTATSDLWIKAVDGDALRRLTETPRANEVYPVWSPDGRQIAFLRLEGEENLGIYVISALGGPERKVSDARSKPSWLPDSQSLVFHDSVGDSVAPVHLVLSTGARRQLTTPPPGYADIFPSVSPDGETLAFIRSRPGQWGRINYTMVAALFVVSMAGGEPKRLDGRASGGPEWSPDGQEIFYPRWDSSGVQAFRIPATGGAAVPAEGLPRSPYPVSISGVRPGGTFRVAVVDARSDAGVRMVDLQTPPSGGRISSWKAFCDSTRLDWPGRFSRDTAHVSFTSDRSGRPQILVADRDGSHVRTLTSFDGGSVGMASWSPDGQFLVFDAVDAHNRSDLHVVSASGGPLRRLTDDEAIEAHPEWSRDGQWIYYASDASGRREIWKIPAAGGEPIKLTTQGGTEPRESPDGRSIYFLSWPAADQAWATTTVNRVGVDGGPVTPVLSGVSAGRWDLVDTGIVYVTGPTQMVSDPATPDALEFYSFADGRSRRLGELPFPVTRHGYRPPRVLSVSPDLTWALVSHMDNWTRDIVVADNFR